MRWREHVEDLNTLRPSILKALTNGSQELYCISDVSFLWAGIRGGREYFAGYSMYRRLLVVISSTLIEDRNWRGMSTTILCFVFLV